MEEIERQAQIEAEKEAERLRLEEEQQNKAQQEKLLQEKKKQNLLRIETTEVDDRFAMMARKSTRARQSTFRMGNVSTKNNKPIKEDEDDPFSSRFNDMIKDGGLPSRKATHSKKVGFSMHQRGAAQSKRVKAQGQVIDDSEEDVDYGAEDYGEEYGQEDEYGAEEGVEDEEILFASQQANEVYGIVMDPLYVELTNYLEKEENFLWAFKNPLIKKQKRSLSLDKARPYEMAEGEYIPN